MNMDDPNEGVVVYMSAARSRPSQGRGASCDVRYSPLGPTIGDLITQLHRLADTKAVDDLHLSTDAAVVHLRVASDNPTDDVEQRAQWAESRLRRTLSQLREALDALQALAQRLDNADAHDDAIELLRRYDRWHD